MPTLEIGHETIQPMVESVWATMLGLGIDALPTSGATEPAPGDSDTTLTAAVQITGAWNGSVLFQPSYEFARHAASIMLDQPAGELSQADIQDAVAELANIVGGGVKSIVPGPSALSLPMVTCGSQFSQRIRRAELILQFDFSSLGEPMRLRLFEGLPPPA